MNHIDEVFRVSRGLPLNYVSRKHADEKFIEALSQESHIVIHGSSKQGKTSLRKSNLQQNDYIDIICSNNWNLSDIHENILKKVGFTLTISESKNLKGVAKVKLKADIPFITSTGIDLTGELGKQINKKNIELDVENVNDIIEALKELEFSRYIVIEDFHYLPENTQIDFSIALKAFHEQTKICFIIVGVWLEDDRLIVHNGDLSGRVKSINADLWNPSDFENLLTKSEELLNIQFHNNFREIVKTACNGSIFLAQQLCHRVCSDNNIMVKSPQKKVIGESFNFKEVIKEILSDQNSRYIKFLTDFSVGFDQTELDLYKWILYGLIVIEKEQLEKGLATAALRRIIEEKHPKKSISQAKLIQALRKAVDLQVKIKIRPIIFEYDTNRTRIKIVDRSFLLWREYQLKKELFEYADLEDYM